MRYLLIYQITAYFSGDGGSGGYDDDDHWDDDHDDYDDDEYDEDPPVNCECNIMEDPSCNCSPEHGKHWFPIEHSNRL